MDYLIHAFLNELRSHRVCFTCSKSFIADKLVYRIDFSKNPNSKHIPYVDKVNSVTYLTEENYAERIIEIGNYFRSY